MGPSCQIRKYESIYTISRSILPEPEEWFAKLLWAHYELQRNVAESNYKNSYFLPSWQPVKRRAQRRRVGGGIDPQPTKKEKKQAEI